MLITCKVTKNILESVEASKKEFIINTPSQYCPGIGVIIEHDSSTYEVLSETYSDDLGSVSLELKQLGFGEGTELEILREYFGRGEKLQAVKFIKENREIGLKEAKEYIDELWDKLR